METKILNKLKAVKKASYALEHLDEETRNLVLTDLASRIRQSSQRIIDENKKDLALMDPHDPKYDRLLLSRERINSIADDVESVASLNHPPAKIIEEKQMPNGLIIRKTAVPLGVIAVIYESRPNVTIDVFTLCFKTGNACILKGGKEAFYSNTVLVSLINETLQSYHINPNVVFLLSSDREEVNLLLNATGMIDACIPRGSRALIEYVRSNAKIPVIETGAGVVHSYFDVSGDLHKGQLIINNAKIRRVSVCNALDTLVIHQDRLDDLYSLIKLLAASQVEIYADELSYRALINDYPQKWLHKATQAHYGHEFLDYKMSIKTVASVEEAVQHIMEHTSGHSEAIIAENHETTTYFLNHIDAAVVYVNASTAFTDGGQFGLGAEIGISTQKLHARGPMGLDALTSYKWVVMGDGHIRS